MYNIYIHTYFPHLFHIFFSLMFGKSFAEEIANRSSRWTSFCSKMPAHMSLPQRSELIFRPWNSLEQLGTVPKLMQMIDSAGVSMMFQSRMTYN